VTPAEVAKAMSALLDGEPVEPDDNFFDVGGTSLLAIELISAIRDRCGVTLPLIDLIGSPTPDGISQLVAACAA
jgi:phthiocerol/phenolphthiocerol synthesis type-I polyketide synthase E